MRLVSMYHAYMFYLFHKFIKEITMPQTMQELAPVEKVEQLTEAAKKLTLEDLQSIREVFCEKSESGKDTEVAAFPCCCFLA
jgi:hypothetical protein